MFGVNSRTRFAALAVASAALVAVTACDKETTAPVLVAAGNTTLGVNSTIASSVNGIPFSFPGGAGALDASVAGQNLTVTFGGTATATTATMAIGTGSITATATFGSCIFVVQTSTFPAGSRLAQGATVVVNPCNINVQTAGLQATGVSASRSVALALGTAVSQGSSITVQVNPGGQLVLNGNSVGTVTLVPVTG